MNEQEARLILQAYRPGADPDGGLAFAGMLEIGLAGGATRMELGSKASRGGRPPFSSHAGR